MATDDNKLQIAVIPQSFLNDILEEVNEAYRNVISVSKLPLFDLISVDKTINKVLLSYSLSQIEIHVEKKSESESYLIITILDKNGSRDILPSTAENALLNFEQAFSLVASGQSELFKPASPKMSQHASGSAVISFIIVVIVLFLLVKVLIL